MYGWSATLTLGLLDYSCLHVIQEESAQRAPVIRWTTTEDGASSVCESPAGQAHAIWPAFLYIAGRIRRGRAHRYL